MYTQMKYLKIVALIFFSSFLVEICLNGAYAQVPFTGQCPQVKLLKTFDLDAYMGIWYSNSEYPFAPAGNRKCKYAKYQNLRNNSISVLNGSIRLDTGKPSTTAGIAYVLGARQLAVVFNSRQRADTVNYIILGTDYTNFTVVYNCKNVNSTSLTKDAFILTRSRHPCPEVVAKAKSILQENYVDLKYLVDTDQSGCQHVRL